MRFEAPAEIGGARNGVGDGEDDKDDGDDGEGGEGAADGVVEVVTGAVLVHADELEEEVGETGYVKELVE